MNGGEKDEQMNDLSPAKHRGATQQLWGLTRPPITDHQLFKPAPQCIAALHSLTE